MRFSLLFGRSETDNLSRSGLRQVIDEVLISVFGFMVQSQLTHDLLRRGEWSNDLSDLQRQLLVQIRLFRSCTIKLWLHRDESVDSLAGNVIRGSDHGSLSDSLVEDQRGLDFGSRQSVSGDASISGVQPRQQMLT